MNNDNLYGSPEQPAAPVLDDIEYSAPTAKKDGPQGVSAPVLDDFGYSAPAPKKDGPQGVSAPVLDDMSDYNPVSAKKGAPENVSAPVLDDNDYTASPADNTLSEDDIIAGLTPEQKAMYDKLPPEKQQQIIEMRMAQLGQQANSKPAVKAPILDDEDSYTPPPKKETPTPAAPVSAPILDDEPAPTKYVPKFADDDLEKVKKEAAKKAVSSQLVSNQKDERESLKMMLELKAEREAEAAAKGFKLVILLGIIGIVAAVLFFLFYSGQYFGLSYTEKGSKFAQIMNEYSLYIAFAAGISALLPITGVGGFKSLCSFIYLVFSIIQIFPGCIMITQMQGSMGIRAVLYAGALICSIAVLVTFSASENIGLFFKKPRREYDR